MLVVGGICSDMIQTFVETIDGAIADVDSIIALVQVNQMLS